MNETLHPAAALKGQDFFLPPPVAVTDWPLPGGTLEQSVEHVDAGARLRRRLAARPSASGLGAHAPRYRPAGFRRRQGLCHGRCRRRLGPSTPRTGGHVWHTRHLMPKHGRRRREGFGGGIAFDDGKLYVSSGFRYVLALDAQSGKTLWRTVTDAPVHAAPTVSNGRVIVESVDDNLMTFDAATGVPGWTYQALGETARILEATSPAVSNGAIVASFASGELVAVRAANGNELWNASLSRANRTNALSEIRDIAGRPVIYKGDVYAVSHSDVFAAIDLRTGNPRWSIPISAITTPWPVGDVVYVTDTSGQISCVARESGQVYWITDMNKGIKKPKKVKGPLWSGPMLASNRLVIVSDQGRRRGARSQDRRGAKDPEDRRRRPDRPDRGERHDLRRHRRRRADRDPLTVMRPPQW